MPSISGTYNTFDASLMKPFVIEGFKTLVAEENGLLNVIRTGTPVRNPEDSWIDDVLQMTNFVASATTSTTITRSGTGDIRDLVVVGAKVRNEANSKEFVVTSMTSAVLTVSPVDGSSTPVTGTFIVNNVPVTAEGSTAGDISFHEGTRVYNNTQIFRRDISITDTALNSDTYDFSNNLVSQTQAKLFEIREALGEAIWFGVKSKSLADKKRTMDGLYSLYAKAGGQSTNGSSASGKLTWKKLSDLAASIQKKGGKPDILICNPAFGTALADLIYANQRTTYDTNVVGARAVAFRNPHGTNDMAIIYDEHCPLSDLWMGRADTMKLHPLGNRDLKFEDATQAGLDGVSYMIIKEVMLEISNVYNHFGYLTGLDANA